VQDMNKSRVKLRHSKYKHKDMFWGSSHMLYVPAFTAWKIFTIFT